MKAFLCCAVLLAFCQSALAQCCDHCGCESNCRKVCRVVCEVKKVPKVEYDCECEDFCVPGPSCRSTVCDECGHKRHVYTPGCGKVRTRTKLIKKETMEEKVIYKWVVEKLCCGCEERCAAADKAAGLTNPDQLAGPIPTAVASQLAQPVNYQTSAAATASPAAQAPAESSQKPKLDLLKIFRRSNAAE